MCGVYVRVRQWYCLIKISFIRRKSLCFVSASDDACGAKNAAAQKIIKHSSKLITMDRCDRSLSIGLRWCKAVACVIRRGWKIHQRKSVFRDGIFFDEKENFRADMPDSERKSSSFILRTHTWERFASCPEIFTVKDGVALSVRCHEYRVQEFPISHPSNLLSPAAFRLTRAFSVLQLFKFENYFGRKSLRRVCCDCAGIEIQGPTESFSIFIHKVGAFPSNCSLSWHGPKELLRSPLKWSQWQQLRAKDTESHPPTDRKKENFGIHRETLVERWESQHLPFSCLYLALWKLFFLNEFFGKRLITFSTIFRIYFNLILMPSMEKLCEGFSLPFTINNKLVFHHVKALTWPFPNDFPFIFLLSRAVSWMNFSRVFFC